MPSADQVGVEVTVIGELREQEDGLALVVADQTWRLIGGQAEKLSELEDRSGRFRLEGVFVQRQENPSLAPKSWERLE